jgi:streptomycin 6-kinase
MVDLPDGVRGMAQRDPHWAAWVDALPATIQAVMGEWGLREDGWAQHGFTALVVPVLDGDDRAAMLKIAFPDEETAYEHLAMQKWQGNGAARLLRADPRRRAMLLERLGEEKLDSIDVVEACEVVAGLYTRLHVTAPAQLDRLSARVAGWATALEGLPRNAPVPRRLVEQAASLARDLAADPATDGRLVHGDLHYLNVLSAEREPWLAIDPKPLSGDPHAELAPMLWNRWDEATATGNVREAVRERFFTLVDHAGLDEDRARAWVVVREMVMALWHLAEPSPGEDGVTVSVTIAKAVQD